DRRTWSAGPASDQGSPGKLLVQELGRVDTGHSGHQGVLLRVGCERSLEGSTWWPRLRWRHALTQVRRTPVRVGAAGLGLAGRVGAGRLALVVARRTPGRQRRAFRV